MCSSDLSETMLFRCFLVVAFALPFICADEGEAVSEDNGFEGSLWCTVERSFTLWYGAGNHYTPYGFRSMWGCYDGAPGCFPYDSLTFKPTSHAGKFAQYSGNNNGASLLYLGDGKYSGSAYLQSTACSGASRNLQSFFCVAIDKATAKKLLSTCAELVQCNGSCKRSNATEVTEV